MGGEWVVWAGGEEEEWEKYALSGEQVGFFRENGYLAEVQVIPLWGKMGGQFFSCCLTRKRRRKKSRFLAPLGMTRLRALQRRVRWAVDSFRVLNDYKRQLGLS